MGIPLRPDDGFRALSPKDHSRSHKGRGPFLWGRHGPAYAHHHHRSRFVIMSKDLIPKEGIEINKQQRFFARYFCLVMTDILVLNLFSEFWSRVHIASFSVSIGAALVLQLLLKITVALEHKVAGLFEDRSHFGARALKISSLWLVLFSSKFVILWALGFTFGKDIYFEGKMHGIVPLITVIVVMILAEFVVAWFTDFLGEQRTQKQREPETGA